MRKPGDHELATVKGKPPAAATRGGLFLLVVGDGDVVTHPLPARGEVAIGRGEGNDVIIDHPSVSRRHAVVRLEDDLTIEDRGSANGTVVRDDRLPAGERATFTAGDWIQLGAVRAMVQQAAPAVQPRRVWPHGYFEGRVDEECARAARRGGGFSVLRLHADAAASAVMVEQLLVAVLRPYDVLGLFGPGEYEALLPDATPEETDGIVTRLRRVFQQSGVAIGLGIGSYPVDGRDAGSLLDKASGDAQGRRRPTAAPPPSNRAARAKLEELAERVARGNISVVILGETGVGKEVMAERIHRLSPRADHPFLRLNCAALSETLLESELFGHERGSFTGAFQAKPGLLETADGGTVFLDEVGELPPSTQVKLLRVLEDRKVLRVGGLKPISIDVRFIAATNRDLEAEVERGAFRSDLFFRLSGVTLVVPPLRQRLDEIEELAASFIAEACRLSQRAGAPQLAPEALALLLSYSWPGNIRELRNVMERAVLLCKGERIGPDDLPVEKMAATRAFPTMALLPLRRPTPIPEAPRRSKANGTTASATLGEMRKRALRELDEAERTAIFQALEACVGNQTRAARMLGISRRTLLKRLDAYGAPRPRKGR